MRRFLSVVGALAVLGVLNTADAEAKFCGDDIGGVRIACACGDVVASDTVLQPGDPVVSGRCEVHGLIIRADRVAESIHVNLGGLAIVGSGHGIGIKIESGGTDGAVVVGGDPPRLGEVVGFGIGVTSTKPNALARLERVSAKGNVDGGFQLRQSGAVVQDLLAEKNGGHGIQVNGMGGRFLGLRANENHHRGISVASPGAIVSGTGNFNGTHGVVVPSPKTRLESVEAHGNDEDGVVLRKRSQRVAGVKATGNGKVDLRMPKNGSSEVRP